MDGQLTIAAIARRAQSMSASKPVVARTADGSVVRATWSSVIGRASRLAHSLADMGIGPGDRVGTLCWNSLEHLESYFAVPASGAVLHTLNTRVSDEQLRFMLEDVNTRTLIVDETLLARAARLLQEGAVDNLIVTGTGGQGAIGYEDLVSGSDDGAEMPDDLAEEGATCVVCHTTGTTGRPKAVAYSHRALAVQSLVLMAADLHGIRERDVVMVAVPMFHANAWGHPYAAALAGASLVLPNRDLSPESLLHLIESEAVTHTGGVPSVWSPVLERLDAEPQRFDTSSMEILRFGGMKPPVSLLRGFEERHGIPVVHGFGMTELAPMGGMAVLTEAFEQSPEELQWRQRAKQGRPIPFLETRARDDDGAVVPWDGKSLGELEVRGPSVASRYEGVVGDKAFTADGWFRTGDVVTIDSEGFIEIQDRLKDLIKSGGEWINSAELETAICSLPSVVEAAVVGVPDKRWQERPLAFIVWADDACGKVDTLREQLADRVPSWWVPSEFRVVQKLPRTAVGKIRKQALRDELELERKRT